MGTCAIEGCTDTSVGKSKYCTPHKEVAHKAWKALITDNAEEREGRNRAWADLHKEAHEAGMRASEAHKPTPMGVVGGGQTYVVAGGVCGFAWVKVVPGGCSFARWAKKNVDRSHKGYRNGLEIWCPLSTQSMTTKESYCDAYAKVLESRGVKAYSQSRMD